MTFCSASNGAVEGCRALWRKVCATPWRRRSASRKAVRGSLTYIGQSRGWGGQTLAEHFVQLALLQRTHPDFEDHTPATGFIFLPSSVAERLAAAAAAGGEKGEKAGAQGRFGVQNR